jgi:predicted nucleic acid-binding Zn ribbon protein
MLWQKECLRHKRFIQADTIKMNDETTMPNPKTCLECGKPLGAGREDRKYCDDICRTTYNNRRRKENQLKEPATPYQPVSDFQKVFNILLSNRNILEMYELYVQEPYLSRDLVGKGFNPKFFTSEYQMDGVGIFKFCFDYGYHVTESGRVYIMERSEEIFLPYR